jgi:hypothetical protein
MKTYYVETYDHTDKYSIEKYGQRMVGHTFNELCDMDTSNMVLREEETDYVTSHENKARKGGLGQIVEERFFHYKANNEAAPDFKEAGFLFCLLFLPAANIFSCSMILAFHNGGFLHMQKYVEIIHKPLLKDISFCIDYITNL